ncbi:MAG: prepilin peptidase [Candidatus Margulisbacteria bacterium]|nr:prepilin peptidase [Candidatus Margulisiibacteriota bacterium]
MLYLFLLFVIGTIVGSFLNVCIHRLPRGESIIFPASHCPLCHQRLKAFDLVPILTYLFLRGQCRYCKAPISSRYPLVEFMTGAFFVVAAIKFPLLSLSFWFAAVFSALLIIVFFVDLEQMVVPDVVSVGGISLGLLYNLARALAFPQAGEANPFWSALAGVILGFLLFFLIGALGKFLFKKEAIGEGDLFLAAMLGACLGWQQLLLAVFLAYLLAGVVSLVLLAAGKLKMGDYVPFGPALVSGGLVALFFGQQILNWYLNLFYVV